MKDNNIVAFYCSNCHKTVLNCEHNFEQLHEKGLCAECLKKQNKPTISKTKSVDNYFCKWQKLKEYIGSQIIHYDRLTGIFRNEKNDGCVLLSTTKRRVLEEILYKMQELEGEDE